MSTSFFCLFAVLNRKDCMVFGLLAAARGAEATVATKSAKVDCSNTAHHTFYVIYIHNVSAVTPNASVHARHREIMIKTIRVFYLPPKSTIRI